MESPPNERWMRRAIALSKRGFPAPNPHVGCVVVNDNQVVGEGFHAYAGGPHAERVALNGKAHGADVYVTLEPCSHTGRTPPCTEALLQAGVSRVIYACPDPNPTASGGAAVLRAAGVFVTGGFLAEEAARANHVFLHAMTTKRPYTVLKAAMGLDGRIALPNGESKWITGPEARRAAHRLRAELGCVLVGAGTVKADAPSLTARIPNVRNQPRKVVLDPHQELSGGETASKGALLIREKVAPAKILETLFAEGQIGVLVEGGQGVLSSFVKAQCFDAIELFVAPLILGRGLTWIESALADSIADVPRLQIHAVKRRGDDLQISLRWPSPRTSP